MSCALRRSELAALELRHIQQRGGRWVFVDVVGKGKRIRTVLFDKAGLEVELG